MLRFLFLHKCSFLRMKKFVSFIEQLVSSMTKGNEANLELDVNHTEFLSTGNARQTVEYKQLSSELL